jgi:hypothetical protein
MSCSAQVRRDSRISGALLGTGRWRCSGLGHHHGQEAVDAAQIIAELLASFLG